MAEGRNENDVLKKIGTKRECPLATRMRKMGTAKDFGFMLRRFGCRAAFKTRRGFGHPHDTALLHIPHCGTSGASLCSQMHGRLGFVREALAMGWNGHAYGRF